MYDLMIHSALKHAYFSIECTSCDEFLLFFHIFHIFIPAADWGCISSVNEKCIKGARIEELYI